MRTLVSQRAGRRTAVTAALAPLLLLTLVACGQDPDDPGIATADGAKPSASASNAAKSDHDPQKWADCMEKNGVHVMVANNGKGGTTTRVGGGPGSKPMDKGKMEKAAAACKQYEPEGGPSAGGPPMSKADQQKFLKFAQCMRDHGVPMQDPKFEGGGAQLGITSNKGQHLEDGKVQAAQKACESNLPAPAQAKPGTTGGGA
jgi:hypothetical protein